MYKNVHFSFNNDIYIQIDGVATGSPLGPVIDTFVYVKRGSIEYVLSLLNSFHHNTKSTYEQENNNRLPFLDVLFIRDYQKINTTVFRKGTHNDLYLHWELFSPISWKQGA